MTGKAILEALSFVDEAYIEEAENGTVRNGVVLRKLLPMAACLCLILLGLRFFDVSASNEAAADTENMHAEQEVILETHYKVENSLNEDCDAAIVMDEEVKPNISQVPTVILRIEEWNADGFTATVEENMDAEAFAPGAQLQADLAENICIEVYSEDLVQVYRRKPTGADFPAGSLVKVRYVSFDEEENTIRITAVSLAEDEKG